MVAIAFTKRIVCNRSRFRGPEFQSSSRCAAINFLFTDLKEGLFVVKYQTLKNQNVDEGC